MAQLRYKVYPAYRSQLLVCFNEPSLSEEHTYEKPWGTAEARLIANNATVVLATTVV